MSLTLAETGFDDEGATVTAIQMAHQGGPEVVHLGELPGPEPGLGEVLLKVDAIAVSVSGLMGRGWIASRQVRAPAVRPLPLGDAARARWLAEAFTPGTAERGFGRIVFVISDTFWDPPAPMLLPYVASKGALVGIMRILARALGPDGIAVTAVAPGLTDTPASRTVNTDVQFDAAVDRQALKRRLPPADTAAAVAFLASDGAAALTGQILCADGGLILR
jgi:NAD(P)-dependent dehydrogenase (short-subunit alcohol dehydrogenase family)